MIKVTTLARRLFRPKVIREHGVLLDLTSEAISPGLRNAFYQGRYETEEMSILKKTLEPDDTFLDIGAGVGLTAIWAAKQIKTAKRVCAVEASPRIVELIGVNAVLNDVDILIKWNAVTNHSGDTDFYMTPHFWSSSLLPMEDAQQVRVPSVSLDALLQEHAPTYVMIDIEGAEHMILRNSTLDAVEKLCVEIHPHYIGQKKSDDLIHHLLDIGFKVEESLCVENGYFFYRN